MGGSGGTDVCLRGVADGCIVLATRCNVDASPEARTLHRR